MPVVCDICGESPARMNNIFEKRFCEKCRDDPEYKLIYKTTAKKKYRLTDDDIKQLECFESESYQHRCTVTLVREIDAMNCFCDKNKITIDEIEETIENMDSIKKKRSQKRLETKQNKKDERKKDLKRALKRAGLELRTDSKLCEGFINGDIKDWTIDKIVNRMCQMKYLYDYADMDKYIEKANHDQMEELEAGYIPDTSITDQAEWYALEKIGGYPKKWPWLKKEGLSFNDIIDLNSMARKKIINAKKGLIRLEQLENNYN